MGHPQPATPLQMDNSKAEVIANITIFKDSPKPCTCVFIGCTIRRTKNNSKFTGHSDHEN